MQYTRLWVSFAAVIIASFAVLGYFGGEFYRQAPPVPERVVLPNGEVVFTGQDIKTAKTCGSRSAGRS